MNIIILYSILQKMFEGDHHNCIIERNIGALSQIPQIYPRSCQMLQVFWLQAFLDRPLVFRKLGFWYILKRSNQVASSQIYTDSELLQKTWIPNQKLLDSPLYAPEVCQ